MRRGFRTARGVSTGAVYGMCEMCTICDGFTPVLMRRLLCINLTPTLTSPSTLLCDRAAVCAVAALAVSPQWRPGGGAGVEHNASITASASGASCGACSIIFCGSEDMSDCYCQMCHMSGLINERKRGGSFV